MRQGPAYGKAVAEVAHAWNDDQLERIAGMLIAQHRVLVG
jgi:hypothetical protein